MRMPDKKTTRDFCRWIAQNTKHVDVVVRMFRRYSRHTISIIDLGYILWDCSEVQRYHMAEDVPEHELIRIGRIIAIKYNCL
jgi:hypothetical protein